jgi:hypothetical protein
MVKVDIKLYSNLVRKKLCLPLCASNSRRALRRSQRTTHAETSLVRVFRSLLLLLAF